MTTFEDLFATVTAGGAHFGHRAHVHLTWLAVRATDPATAATLIGEGIRRTARYAGQPRKYHATMTRAWVELIAARMAPADQDFDTFVARNPQVLDKHLLNEHYRPGTLATETARTGWVPPDAKPLRPAPAGASPNLPAEPAG